MTRPARLLEQEGGSVSRTGLGEKSPETERHRAVRRAGRCERLVYESKKRLKRAEGDQVVVVVERTFYRLLYGFPLRASTS